MNITDSTCPEQLVQSLAEVIRRERLKTNIALKHRELTELTNIKLSMK